MVRAQKEMLQRFEKTNEMLTNVNSLSAVRLEKVGFVRLIIILLSPMVPRPTMISRSTHRIL